MEKRIRKLVRHYLIKEEMLVPSDEDLVKSKTEKDATKEKTGDKTKKKAKNKAGG